MDRRPAPRPTRLLLVRHGETEAAARGRCVGRLDVGLSEAGHAQAAALAERLRAAGPAAIYASASRRALDTARPTADACGLAIEPVEALREVSFGALEGLTFEEVETRYPEAWREWMERPASVRFPGGESLADVRDRVLRACAGIARCHAGRAVVIFSHAGPIRALLGEALGLAAADLFAVELPHGAVVELFWPPGGDAPLQGAGP